MGTNEENIIANFVSAGLSKVEPELDFYTGSDQKGPYRLRLRNAGSVVA